MLTASQKKIISELWNCEIFNFYGSTEAGNIAYSCKYNNLHAAEKYYHFDVYKDDSIWNMKSDKTGVLILTTKAKEAFPLFKYYTEDLVEIKKEQCKCGITSSVFNHYGRADNVIKIDNIVYSEYEIKELVFSIIHKYKLNPFWNLIQENNSVILYLSEYFENDKIPDEIKKSFPANISLQGNREAKRAQQLKYWKSESEIGKPKYIHKRKN